MIKLHVVLSLFNIKIMCTTLEETVTILCLCIFQQSIVLFDFMLKEDFINYVTNSPKMLQ